MKTYEFLVTIVAHYRKNGFERTRALIWQLRYANKISDNQLTRAFEVLRAKVLTN